MSRTFSASPITSTGRSPLVRWPVPARAAESMPEAKMTVSNGSKTMVSPSFSTPTLSGFECLDRRVRHQGHVVHLLDAHEGQFFRDHLHHAADGVGSFGGRHLQALRTEFFRDFKPGPAGTDDQDPWPLDRFLSTEIVQGRHRVLAVETLNLAGYSDAPRWPKPTNPV